MKDLPPSEPNVARKSNAPFQHPIVSVVLLSFALAFIAAYRSQAQEPKRPTGSVQISFLPPPLEKATYSLGIFDAKTNKLVRHLQEAALEKDFTVGLNGLITNWDGKDDNGKSVSPGRYAARGYAVGALKIAGEEIQGNDWVAADENLRIKHIQLIAFVPADSGVVIFAEMADNRYQLLRFSGGEQSRLLWRTSIQVTEPADWEVHSLAVDTERIYLLRALGPTIDDNVSTLRTCRLGDGQEETVTRTFHRLHPAAEASPTPSNSTFTLTPEAPSRAHSTAESIGKNDTKWLALGKDGITQLSLDGLTLRHLEVKPNEPLPIIISASMESDRFYLLEEKPGWQRVRGLSWLETKEENGKPVSTWQTFFERSIHPPSDVTAFSKVTPVEITLAENPLTPGKPQKLRLVAAFDAKGSYLATESGLRLRRISERANLENARLVKGKAPDVLSLFQYDGAAIDEFSIAGVRNIMEFDAGEFEMTATGEKPADPKTAEPPDL